MAVSLPPALWDRLQDVLVKRKEWKVVIVSWQVTPVHWNLFLSRINEYCS